MAETILNKLRILALAGTVAGCAGRSPAPVPVVQPQDQMADCGMIVAETATNNAKLSELASEKGAKVAQNVVAGVAGLFFIPLWFAMDFQGTAGIEIDALIARQQYLAGRAVQMRCVSAPVAQAR